MERQTQVIKGVQDQNRKAIIWEGHISKTTAGPALPTTMEQQMLINELKDIDTVFDFENYIFGNVEGHIMAKDRRAQSAHLADLSTLVDTHDAQIGSLNSQLDAQNSQLDAQNSQLDAQKSRLDAQNSQLDAQKSRLEAQNSRLDAQNSQLDAMKTDVWHIRRAVLDGTSHVLPAAAERNSRNEVAHGGNIMADIELISFMEKLDPAHADTWKSTFYRLYSIHFALRHLATREAIEVFNIYATIRTVLPWSADSSASHAIAVGQCQQLLGAWAGQDGYWEEEATHNLREEVRFYYRRKLFGF